MRTTIFMLGAAAVIAAIAMPQVLDAQPPRTSRAAAGRYQAVPVSDYRVFVIDTRTGESWVKTLGGSWKYEGSPRSGAARTSETSLVPEPAAEDRLQPIPRRAGLDLSNRPVEMSIFEKRWAAVPGSQGTVVVRLSDIDDGQALLAVETSAGETLLANRWLAGGQSASFRLNGRKYILRVVGVASRFARGDFATLTIAAES